MLEIKSLFLLFKKSIKVRLLSYFLLVSILPILLVGFIPYYKSQEIVERQVLELAQSVVNQLNGNINYYLKEMDLMSKIIYFQMVKAYDETDSLDEDEVKNFLMELKKNRTFIQDIHVLTNDQSITTSLYINKMDVDSPEWYIDALKKVGEKTWIGPHKSDYSTNQENQDEVVSLVYPFLYDDGMNVIIIDMKQEEMDTLFTRPDLANLGVLLLIDKYGEVLYSTDQSIFEENNKQYISNTNVLEQLNEENHFIYDINFFSGWKIAALIPNDQINESFNSIKKIVFVLLGIFIIISIILSWVFSNRFSNPLRKLQRDISEVEKGNFTIRSEVDSIDEIGDLSNNFNKMVEEIETLIKKISINEKRKKQIEMRSLQYQINPHFLYNTLNSVQWLAKLYKAPDISEMLTNLIKLLRTSLDSSNHLHMLEEELEVLNYYFKIQNYRYPKSFNVDYQIEPELLSAFVPRFILQPLVENIFFHGFTDGKGNITIKAIRNNDIIEITVEDNGRGMSMEKADNILINRKTGNGKNSSGIGIHNVDDKIKLYFGSNYGLQITSIEGSGTTIRIHIPVTFEQEEDEDVVKRFISR